VAAARSTATTRAMTATRTTRRRSNPGGRGGTRPPESALHV
jgi:hypothetical protein